MDTLTVKSFVLRVLSQAREQEVAFADSLSQEERAASGTPESWSATYTLAHITAAKRRLTDALTTMRRGETPSLHHDEAQVYAENEGRSWTDVEAEAQGAFDAFVAEVNYLSDRDLADPQHVIELEGRPVIAQILGHGVWHPFGHLTAYYRDRGDEERVRRMQLQLLDAVDPVNDIPVLQRDPLTLYNTACVQVTVGRHEKAIELLEKALALDPELRESARSDPDLASLHGNRAFQALATA
jgi:tetratricopeptide (TPR) repeat protein